MDNFDPETGIRFGILNTESLYPWVWDQILWKGKDLSYEVALQRKFPQLTGTDESTWTHQEAEEVLDFWSGFIPETPEYEGENQGVKWRTTWLGTTSLLLVIKSPHVTHARPCCFSDDAGDLHQLDPEGVKTYTVPDAWLEV